MKAVIARLREPSSLAALAVLLGVAGVKVAPESLGTLLDVATVVAGLAGVVIPEGGAK